MVELTDIDTGSTYSFCTDNVENGSRPTEEALKFIDDNATEIIGHFIVGFDLQALKKVYGWRPAKHIKVKDTMVMSQVLDYKRFPNGRHNLDTWGEHFGIKKPEHEDWLNYSPEMLHRCREDVKINVKVYRQLAKELAALAARKPLILPSLRFEHDVLHFVTEAGVKGWRFDADGAREILTKIDHDMLEIECMIEPMLRVAVKRLDNEPKEPKWTKLGAYYASTASYFGINPLDGRMEIPPICGPYNRIEFVKPDMGSIDSLKELLDSLGWVPDDWNWKKIGNEFIKGTPKLTTSSLEPLGEVGMMVDKYYTLRSRKGLLEGWLNNMRGDRVHGDCFTIATPTGRARHAMIVNVPSVGTTYGAEIRKLWIASEGYTIIGADSSGNQMRAFCHYLKNDEYTREVISGDVHTANQNVLMEVVPTVTRKLAKPFLYAFLFGGGAEKLGLIVTGKRDSKIGKKCKDIFIEKIIGLKTLIDKITKVYNATEEQPGGAYIPALDGRKIYVDSKHKALNYLLQSCEGVTCKAATAMCMRKLEEACIPYNPLIFYHDEIEFEVPDEFAEEARIIAKESFRDAPKIFGVEIMDGEAKIGKSWYDVH